MPTLSDISGAECPETDGLSLVPTLTGKGEQKQHDHLYWEYTGQTAVRMKNWKAYKAKKSDWKHFDLSKDIEEKNDLAANRPETLKKLIGLAQSSHQSIKPGEIHHRDLIEKDRRQAPHSRNKPKK
jgi:arylsulfatase A-like enzyme